MADSTTALAARLAAAYLRGNILPISDVPGLIQATYNALAGISAPPAPAITDRPQPAVPVKKSVTPDAIICLDCGRSQKMLKRHVATAHGLTVEDYRSKWGLPADYPMVAPSYAQHRSQLAISIGLGHSRKKPQAAPVADETEAQEAKPRHTYPASRWSKPAG